jgi:hypothetical protein
MALDAIVNKTGCLSFSERMDYNEDLYDFFNNFPSIYTEILTYRVFDKTNNLITNIYEIINNKDVFEKKEVVFSGLASQLPKEYSFLHTILKAKKDVADLTQKTDIAWSYVKFLASMWQPKFIKDLERKEKISKDPAAFSELELEQLASLVGEEKAKKIIEKMRNNEYVIDGDSDPEIYGVGQTSEDDLIAPKMPSGYRLDETSNKYVSSVDARERKETLYLLYLDNTSEDQLDKHDKLMKRAMKKQIETLKTRIDTHTNKANTKPEIVEMTTRYELAERDPTKAQELLRNPVFVVRKKK